MSVAIPSHWIRDVPIGQLTTWRIGGPARLLARPRDLTQLREDLALARRRDLQVLALGAGSNLLFPDKGYDGLLIRLPDAPPRFPSESSAQLVGLAAGASLAGTARILAEHGWLGLHWAEGIPGTLAGAIINNAGAYGGQISRVLESARVLLRDGSVHVWPCERFQFDYRQSCLKGIEPTEIFVLSAAFHLTRQPPAEIAGLMRQYAIERKRCTPPGPSCGSVFRNPTEAPAWRLIREAGLAGLRIGNARISPKHANYIMNLGGASAVEVLELIERCRHAVMETAGIQLTLEVQLAGFG
jgi:UDP-N-acetylmuramate dehydrogenase